MGDSKKNIHTHTTGGFLEFRGQGGSLNWKSKGMGDKYDWNSEGMGGGVFQWGQTRVLKFKRTDGTIGYCGKQDTRQALIDHLLLMFI